MILRTLLRLLGEVALWSATLALVAGVTAAGARSTIARSLDLRSLFVASLLGGLAFAGLVDRLGLPGAVVLDIGRRPLPVVWVAAGALVGTLALWVARRPGPQMPASEPPGSISG